MTEIRQGIFKLLGGSTLLRAVVYTIGHIIIAAACNAIITGASLDLAAVDAIVEPIINGVWYYMLDYLFIAKERKN